MAAQPKNADPEPKKTLLPLIFGIGMIAGVVVLISVRGSIPSAAGRRNAAEEAQLGALSSEIAVLTRDIEAARHDHRDEIVKLKEHQLERLKAELAQIKHDEASR